MLAEVAAERNKIMWVRLPVGWAEEEREGYVMAMVLPQRQIRAVAAEAAEPAAGPVTAEPAAQE